MSARNQPGYDECSLASAEAQPSAAGWIYRPEYHLGDPAFSLFDPNGDRSAVGLTHADARAICTAMNAAPELYGALKFALEILYEADLRLGYADGSLGQIEIEEAIEGAKAALQNAAPVSGSAEGVAVTQSERPKSNAQ